VYYFFLLEILKLLIFPIFYSIRFLNRYETAVVLKKFKFV